jgi:ribose/xylose/arabinose/galactoside ABC-type transport system permease subunit
MNSSGSAGGGWRLPRHELAILAATVAVFVVTGWLDPNHTYFANGAESRDIIVRNTALLGIIALGASVVIIAGGIDLSAGSMVAFSATTCALVLMLCAAPDDRRLVTVGPAGIAAAVGAAMLSGLLVGTLHTWLITAVRLPPFIATLATLVGLRSFARALCESCTLGVVGTKSAQINVSDPIFKAIRDNVWIPVAVFALLAVFTWLLLTRTVLGRHIHALGGNEQAARLAGIRTENVKWFAYCFGAMTAALAGLFYVANESVAAPVNQGRGHELNAIAAAVVGGCSLSGGVGTVPGTVLGAIFLRVVIDAVSKIIKTGADVYEGLIVGVVVVIAVTFSQLGALAKGGTRLLPGAIGLCAIPTLSLLTGALAAMTAGRNGGIATGVGALFLLGLLRVWESRRSTT